MPSSHDGPSHPTVVPCHRADGEAAVFGNKDAPPTSNVVATLVHVQGQSPNRNIVAINPCQSCQVVFLVLFSHLLVSSRMDVLGDLRKHSWHTPLSLDATATVDNSSALCLLNIHRPHLPVESIRLKMSCIFISHHGSSASSRTNKKTWRERTSLTKRYIKSTMVKSGESSVTL